MNKMLTDPVSASRKTSKKSQQNPFLIKSEKPSSNNLNRK